MCLANVFIALYILHAPRNIVNSATREKKIEARNTHRSRSRGAMAIRLVFFAVAIFSVVRCAAKQNTHFHQLRQQQRSVTTTLSG